MSDLRLIAILGGSGSGKSALGLELAHQLDCEIFSLDSLSIYREIDIASAKPTQAELQAIHHYAINHLKPTEENNAMLFHSLLLEAIAQTKHKGKDTLLIIGGSSFYLKSILGGLSAMPTLTTQQKQEIHQQIAQISNPYEFLLSIDSQTTINPKDSYRVCKALEIYFATHTPPTQYFQENPQKPFCYPIEKYSLALERQVLRERISQRTQAMIANGLIDEVQNLIRNYGTHIQPANAIGVKETIEYLSQTPLNPKPTIIAQNLEELGSLISTHTAQLAKRQNTFNRTQFGVPLHCNQSPDRIYAISDIVYGNQQELYQQILSQAR
ncbi:tRNA (adenosine(37)-N6)-dimethylallyltransferase MiaA [Helicobacter enhydrae]|uniref:tRNA dimethylallyltransferase n=1 Tax=Helicobacter enhydrae TaxID=222136 RepID=A0A1B1U4Y5_9HELI|nr:tRNA (adenosine(37)-N6)-dimethylallyltransferase MiaA [Helicobacter enhydrae]ANV97833.1 tRNA (adenosine(37)-N6)-dimethylallyltransferase MiaA [Helicobacter enhydrae]